MRCSLLAAAFLLLAAPATAQRQAAPPPDRDAECFLLAAVGSQRLTSGEGLTPEARRAEPMLRATANYFAGRLSTRLRDDALRQALAGASGAVQRPNLGALVEGCTGEFQAFMRTVAAPAARVR